MWDRTKCVEEGVGYGGGRGSGGGSLGTDPCRPVENGSLIFVAYVRAVAGDAMPQTTTTTMTVAAEAKNHCHHPTTNVTVALHQLFRDHAVGTAAKEA